MSETLSAMSLIKADLDKSGLKPEDVGAYVAQEAEISAVGLKPHLYIGSSGLNSPGYIIPYYDITGKRAPFYRIKLFNPTGKGVKYLQPQHGGSWVYFPQQFATKLSLQIQKGNKPPIIVTEGEKKAAKAVQDGFIACAVGGIYNWRSKTIVLPEGTELARNKNGEVVAKLKGSIQTPTSDKRGVLATGLNNLIWLAKQYHLPVVIIFDSDWPVNPDVQVAAAELAAEMRFHGIPTTNIRQVFLTTEESKTKIGLDDFLILNGVKALSEKIDEALNAKSAYPIHPNLKALIAKSLDSIIDRSEVKELSLMIIADLDRNGTRMVDKSTGVPYYFDNRTRVLMPVNLLHHHQEPLHETRFGEFLYRMYDISQADMKLITWLAATFTGEVPIEYVDPKSVIALTEQGIAIQIDDGQYIHITGTSKPQICLNGTNGIMFRAGQVNPTDPVELITEIASQLGWLKTCSFEDLFWTKCTKQFKWLRPYDATIMTILSYISPWFQRWRGTQLPLELMIGEPGSGKSSMYSLRLVILTGMSALRNQPTDIRDWYASITSQDGMHVIDNIGFASKEIKSRLSDEICRLVTEPQPTVEMRKLFTTSDNIRVPVRCVFAMTAIQQPFVNADIMQRSIIMDLAAIGDNHSTDWCEESLRTFGGRVRWLAHHIAIIHLFLESIHKGNWQVSYKSKHRLVNFQQMFEVMGTLLKVPDLNSLIKQVAESSQVQVSEQDWTLEAIRLFNLTNFGHVKNNLCSCSDISEWAQNESDFEENQIITNPRRLARYIRSHAHLVQQFAGLTEDTKIANKQMYKLTRIVVT